MPSKTKETISLGYSKVPRYYYHRPPEAQNAFAEAGKGLKAYKNRNHDGSTASIERAFGVDDPDIIWLSPTITYGCAYIIDLSLVEKSKLKATGQFEGNLWHLGDISPDAVIGFKEREKNEI